MKKLREIWNTIFDNEKDRRLMTAGVIALVGICLFILAISPVGRRQSDHYADRRR